MKLGGVFYEAVGSVFLNPNVHLLELLQEDEQLLQIPYKMEKLITPQFRVISDACNYSKDPLGKRGDGIELEESLQVK